MFCTRCLFAAQKALQKIKSQETGQKMRKRYYFRIARKEFFCKRNTVFYQCMYKRGRCALFLAIFNNNFGRVFTLREEHIGRARNQALIKVDDCDDLSYIIALDACKITLKVVNRTSKIQVC